MNRRTTRIAGATALALACLFPVSAFAQQQPAAAAKPTTAVDIGYVELADNPMYDSVYAYYMVPVRPLARSH